MARLQLVTANKEARAPRVRTSAKPVSSFVPAANEEFKDHFITRNGLTYAGSHLIIDLWEAEGLNDRDPDRTGADRCGARSWRNPASHTSAHVLRRRRHIWCCRAGGEPYQRPHLARKGYAAFDVFMCGDAEPRKAMKRLQARVQSWPYRCRRAQARRSLGTSAFAGINQRRKWPS